MIANTTTALDAALNAIDDSIGQYADDSALLVAAKCRGLMRGYDRRWRDSNIQPLSVERTLTAPLLNPETNGTSRTFSLAGKLDVLAAENGQSVLIDHKTTSQDIGDPDASYWRQLAVEGQVNHYMLLAWQQGQKIDTALWDVIRKPTISPKKLTKADQRAVVSLGKYFDTPVSQASRDALVNDERETLELYEIRLANDCMFERPEWYFQRRKVPRLDRDILEYANEAWQHGQDIIACRASSSEDRLPVRNSGACMLYGSPCNFLGICSGYDSPDSGKWRKKESVHPELPIIEGDGKDLLTNSRIRCFQTCKRKHFYQYEMGIERHDAEEKESLFFGSVFHAAQEAWWTTFLKG